VTLLLGAAVLTLERDENVLARLLRSGARPVVLIGEKVALCAIVGCILGILLALGFGVAAEISSSGAAWARIPLLLVPLAAAGAAFGALGCVVGAAARDLRAASLVGVALVTPVVLVGLVPREVSPLAADVSELLPFAPAARAFGATLFDSAPLTSVLAASAHLLLLTAVLGAGSLALFSRFQR
jgi:ABC-type polysaccharide/polyol phosphate export permease